VFLSGLFKKFSNRKEVVSSQPTLTNVDLDNRNRQYEKDNSRMSLRKGELGEYKIDIQLDQLPKTFKYISDLMLPNPRSRSGYSQIDHVVIGPSGIFVIETKNYTGDIYGTKNDKMWLRDGKYEFLNPFRQNFGHMQAIKEHLKDFDTGPFSSIIIFTLRASIRNVDEELKNVRTSTDLVIYDTALLDTVNRRHAIMASGNLQSLSKIDIERIHSKLSSLNITDIQAREEHVNKNKRQKVNSDNLTFNDVNCVICGRPVSIKVKDYCLANKNRFGGKIYCFEHQKNF
jgi:hypothetical protein